MDTGAAGFPGPGSRTARDAEAIDPAAMGAHERGDIVSLLVEAQERERRRIADDVHDDSVQVLSAVLLGLHQIRSHVASPQAIALVDRLEEDVQLATRRLRWLIFDLQPRMLESDGLVAALRSYLAVLSEETGISVELVAEALEAEPPSRTKTILYRIIQEALANARKHSRARRVRVSIASEDGGFVTTVADDGVGLDRAAKAGAMHVGLGVMRERAEMAGGWFELDAAGAGTTIRFWVPGQP